MSNIFTVEIIEEFDVADRSKNSETTEKNQKFSGSSCWREVGVLAKMILIGLFGLGGESPCQFTEIFDKQGWLRHQLTWIFPSGLSTILSTDTL